MSRYYTIRPQNTCLDCDYTWYPRGKNKSICCPRCKSREVQIVKFSSNKLSFVQTIFSLTFVAIIAFVAILALFNKQNKQEHTKKQVQPIKSNYKYITHNTNNTTTSKKPVYAAIKNEKAEDDILREEPGWEEIERENEQKRAFEEEENKKAEYQKQQKRAFEEEENKKKEKINLFEKRLEQTTALTLESNPNGKHLKMEYVIIKLCKMAKVPYMQEQSRENFPDLKNITLNKFVSNDKSYSSLIRILASSRRMEYIITEKGLVLIPK